MVDGPYQPKCGELLKRKSGFDSTPQKQGSLCFGNSSLTQTLATVSLAAHEAALLAGSRAALRKPFSVHPSQNFSGRVSIDKMMAKCVFPG